MSTESITSKTLPATASPERVHLSVPDLGRSVAWYERVLGLRVMAQTADGAELGDGVRPVVVLHEDRTATQDPRSAGIYHFALLFPSRPELARAALRLATQRTPVEGLSDHRTHEAIYLRDPDGIGIELAADRPRSAWPADLGYSAGPAPLDLADLLATIDGEAPTPHVGDGLRLGHVHLHVGDIDEAVRFYRDVVGFSVTANLGSAAFFAAGDYHHHVATNVWRGQGIAPQPEGVVGLRHWDLVLPNAGDVDLLRERLEASGQPVSSADGGILTRDPSHIPLMVTAAA